VTFFTSPKINATQNSPRGCGANELRCFQKGLVLQCGTISHRIFRFAKRPDDITRSAAVKQKFSKNEVLENCTIGKAESPTIQDEGFGR
jgi:hypothetical protein